MIIGIDIRNIGKERTGDEAVFLNLTKKLSQIDNENEYWLFTDITDEIIIEKIKKTLGIENKNNFKIVSLKSKNRFSWNFWNLGKYVRSNPLDVYLTQYITPLFVPKKIKIVTIIHDISFNFFPAFIKWSDLLFLKIFLPLSIKRADKIIAVSKFTRDEILAYYKISPEKITWMHNAVSDKFSNQNRTEEKIKQIREKYNLPEKFILYLGTLQPRKNLVILIEAFALVKSETKLEPKLNSIKLVLASKKGHNYDKRIDAAIKKNDLEDEVIFPGYIKEEDKPALMAAAEIFCFPSLYEGFGIPILEAMSSSVPVVASDIVPHHEIALDAAMFFNPEIAGELAQKLMNLLRSEVSRNDLVKKGQENIKKFSWQKTADKLLRVFKGLK